MIVFRHEAEHLDACLGDVSLIKNDEGILAEQSHLATGNAGTAPIGPSQQSRKHHIWRAKNDGESRRVGDYVVVLKNPLTAQDGHDERIFRQSSLR